MERPRFASLPELLSVEVGTQSIFIPRRQATADSIALAKTIESNERNGITAPVTLDHRQGKSASHYMYPCHLIVQVMIGMRHWYECKLGDDSETKKLARSLIESLRPNTTPPGGFELTRLGGQRFTTYHVNLERTLSRTLCPSGGQKPSQSDTRAKNCAST